MNLDIHNNQQPTQGESNNILLKYAKAWNDFSIRGGNTDQLVDLDFIGNFAKQKSFTGASTVTGSGLADLTPARGLGFIVQEAGGFTDFMDLVPTAESNVKYNTVTATGNFQNTNWDPTNYPLGARFPAGNEISAFNTLSLNLEEKQAIISGRTKLLAQSLQSEDLLPVATQVLMNQKKLTMESEIAASFALNGSIVESALVGSLAPIHLAMKKLIGGARFKDESGQRQVFVMSYGAYAQLTSEQSNSGEFISSNKLASMDEDVRYIDMPVGYKGRFGGYKVYVSSGIGENYTVTANRVTALTGGTKTLIGFGLPYQVKGGMSKLDRDNVSIFDRNNSLPSAINGTTTFFMSFHFGQVIAAPQYWRYLAI